MKQKVDIKEIVSYAMNFCKQDPAVLFLLRRLRSYDVHLYMQTVRTAYFSLELSKGLNLTKEEQEVIYRSALLQDVGKMQQNKTDFLNHPFYSVELLKSFIQDG